MVTDITGNYKFQSKPNRNYILSLRDSLNDYKELFVNNNDNTETKTLPVVSLKSIDSVYISSVSKPITSNNKNKYDVIASIENPRKVKVGEGDQTKSKNKKTKSADGGLLSRNPPGIIGNSNNTESEFINYQFIVYYPLDQSTHNAESLLVLDSLIIILNKDPKLYAVIGSFTDCKGSVSYNMELSNKRSKATVDYLVAHGIDISRIIESHYGETYLNTECLTNNYQSTEQLSNRRTEIFVTRKNQLFWIDLHNNSFRVK